MKDIEGGMILAYPIGIGGDNVYLNNLGYKVPIKVELSNSMITSVKTKVSNYGIFSIFVCFLFVFLSHLPHLPEFLTA